MPGMTREELFNLPAVVNLVTAGRALGIGETKTRELARSNAFPVRLLRVGNRYRVSTADILAYLGLPRPAAEPAA
ncbi:DNA-binding protein [Actinosynnema sp.]|uniref:DNA-binding protein n=1 Tax=Actinosynnema sp. TaxID=1872144 RepID=UPI003F85D889